MQKPMQQNSRKVSLTFLMVGLMVACVGCQYSRNTSNYPPGTTRPNFDPPPTDAYALTGGKITTFIPKPGLPSDPADKSLLQACQMLKLAGHTARSGYVVFNHRGEKPIINALVIGGQVLVIVEDAQRQLYIGDRYTPAQYTIVLYPQFPPGITLTAGSRWAKVGNARILLKTPVVQLADTHEFVMTLPDLMTVFKVRDAQRGHNIHDVRDAKVIYNLPPLGHF